MVNNEVLVHVSAPARLQDDQQYRALSESINYFQAATVTRIYDGVMSTIVESTFVPPADKEARVEEGHLQASRFSDTTKVRRRSTHLKSSGITKTSTQLRSSLPGSSTVNPPYRNPFPSHRFLPQTILVPQTPDLHRPKTAPPGPSGTFPTRQTDSRTRKRKRPLSETSSFSTVMSSVSDTQDSRRPRKEAHETNFGDLPPLLTAKNIDPSHTVLDLAVQETRKTPGSVYQGVNLITNIGRPSLLVGFSGPFFLPDRSLDWTSSSAPSMSVPSVSSASSTVSPSQSTKDRFRRQETLAHPQHLERWRESPPVDLTKPMSHTDEVRENDHREISRPTAFASGMLMPSSAEEADDVPMEDQGIGCQYAQILGLQRCIEPLAPMEFHRCFTTHITSTLELVVKRLPFERFFKPQHVARDVRALERGYWSLPIHIGSDVKVFKHRQDLETEEAARSQRIMIEGATALERFEKWKEVTRNGCQFGEASTACKRRQPFIWTEVEFFEFWSSLAKFVGNGKAGWGVRVMMDDVLPMRGELLELHLKIFTWGEVLGHIWLLLWVLSDKLVTYIPMEWRDAEEVVVIRMTGERHKGGKLLPWMLKGPVGDQGVWGIGTPKEGSRAV